LRLGEALAATPDWIRGDVLRVSGQILAKSGNLAPLKHRKPGDFRDVPLPTHVGKAVLEGSPFAKNDHDIYRRAFRKAARAAGLPPSLHAAFAPTLLRECHTCGRASRYGRFRVVGT
jgi:hypothetical protein